MTDQSWTVVYVSASWVEASFVANALEGSGLPTMKVDGEICRLMPAYTEAVHGIKVMVEQADEGDALALLGSLLGGEPPYTGSWLTTPLSFLALLFQMLRNALLRPRVPVI